MLGLSDAERAAIADALGALGVERAVVFGSRTRGDHRYNSDIDIALLEGRSDAGEVFLALDELPLPYKFDVVRYADITSAALRAHIDRVGVEIYPGPKTFFTRPLA